jgi:hypothetical protein
VIGLATGMLVAELAVPSPVAATAKGYGCSWRGELSPISAQSCTRTSVTSRAPSP